MLDKQNSRMDLLEVIDCYANLIRSLTYEQSITNSNYDLLLSEAGSVLAAMEVPVYVRKVIKKCYSMIFDFHEMINAYEVQVQHAIADRQKIRKVFNDAIHVSRSIPGKDIPASINSIKSQSSSNLRNINTAIVNAEYRLMGVQRARHVILCLGNKMLKYLNKHTDIIDLNKCFIDRLIEYALKLNAYEERQESIKFQIGILEELSWVCQEKYDKLDNDGISVLDDFTIKEDALTKFCSISCPQTYIFSQGNDSPCLIFKDEESLKVFILENDLDHHIRLFYKWMNLCRSKKTKDKDVKLADFIRALFLYTKEILSSPLQMYLLSDYNHKFLLV